MNCQTEAVTLHFCDHISLDLINNYREEVGASHGGIYPETATGDS